MDQLERRRYLIEALIKENPAHGEVQIPTDAGAQRKLLRGLMNVREAGPINEAFLQIQDEYLIRETQAKGVTYLADLKAVRPGLYLWQGDITTLACDAIVNAANSSMTGCYYPNHGCIDNAIHTFAGVQLRNLCAEIMEAQGHLEPTGQAKITPGFNLPAKYILHTVGPIVRGALHEADETALADCYRACLQLAAEHHLESVAFCCISTGEFGFPNARAAEIAVATVKDFMRTPSSIQHVIFNVFKDTDLMLYETLLEQ